MPYSSCKKCDENFHLKAGSKSHRRTEGQGKSIIAPTFSKRGYKYIHKYIEVRCYRLSVYVILPIYKFIIILVHVFILTFIYKYCCNLMFMPIDLS